jgi:hypothetical protein
MNVAVVNRRKIPAPGRVLLFADSVGDSATFYRENVQEEFGNNGEQVEGESRWVSSGEKTMQEQTRIQACPSGPWKIYSAKQGEALFCI